MTDFDPMRALREEISGLCDVMSAVKQRERSAEAAISQAEHDLNATRKIVGFVRIALAEKRDQLQKLEQASST